MTKEQFKAEITAVMDSILLAGDDHLQTDILWQTALIKKFPELAHEVIDLDPQLADMATRVMGIMLKRIMGERAATTPIPGLDKAAN